MSVDGFEPTLSSGSGGIPVDHDGDGRAEALYVDAHGDGYHETIVFDRDGDGYYEEIQNDSNLDGRVDVQMVDDNLDRVIDRTFVDTDGDGLLEQQNVSVIPPGQPGGAPAVDQGYSPQGEVPTDFSGQSPEDLAQWLNHPNVQANPELESLIRRMLNFSNNASMDFLNIKPGN